MRIRAFALALLFACGGSGPSEPESCGTDSCPEADTVCVDVEGGGFTCECRPGTVRDADGVCRVPTRCEEGTCLGRGSCDDSSGVVVCTCDPEFAGDACERCADGYHEDGLGGCTMDACLPNPCPIDRRCVDMDGTALCACPPGSHEEGDDCVPDTECGPGTCNDHGDCDDSRGSVECTCDEGWAGTFCEGCDEVGGYHDDGMGGCTMDACLPNPCTDENRTVCTVGALGDPECGCDPGYHDEGGLCVIDETCLPTTCSGNGMCSVLDGRVSCVCDEGWTGTACEGCDEAAGYHDDGMGGCTTDPCVPNMCTAPNQGVCVEDGGAAMGFRCDCDAGFHPDGVGGCTDDPCIPDPCAAMGQACRNAGGAAECYTPMCDDDNPCTDDTWTGSACDFAPRVNGSPCSTTLCTAGQTCLAGMCQGGSAVDCDDTNPCTDDSCDALTGCANVDDDSNVPDDGIACTVDSCSGGVASNVATDARCDDAAWCTGVETCAPTDPLADGNGCLTSDVPTPPGPSGPCGSWTCNESTMDFSLDVATPGTGCSDGIACTTGDACTAGGACVGTITGDCTGGTCSTTPWSSDVDLAPARVRGTIVYAGGALPAHSDSTTDIAIYLKARDTGSQQLLEVVTFGSWDGSGYPQRSFNDRDDLTIDSPVLPGVYEVIYRRWSSGDGSSIGDHQEGDAYAFGNRVLASGVVIGPGINDLDVDLAPSRVMGAIQFSGGALPTHSASTTDIAIYLKAQDTGSEQLLEVVTFGSWDGTGYPQRTFNDRDDLAVDLPVLPGTYDVIYRRWSSGDGSSIGDHQQTDAYAFGYRVLQSDVVVGSSPRTLNVDLAPGRVMGSVLHGGAPLPAHSTSTTDIAIYLKARDTGSEQLLEVVTFGSWDGSGYPQQTFNTRDDLMIDLPVLPGTYDVIYRRWSSGDGSSIGDHQPADSYAFGYRVLQSGLTVSGATPLTVDLAPGHVTGTLRYSGGALPPRSTSTTDIAIYLKAQDTGSEQLLEVVTFGSWDGTGYPQQTFNVRDDLTVDLPVLPGTYDVIYRRWSSGDGSSIGDHQPGDSYAFGYRVLQSGVVVSGTTPLNVELAPGRVMGNIVYGSGALPPRSTSTTDIAIYLKARDTGSEQLLEVVTFGSWDGTGYPQQTFNVRDDLVVDLPVLPGTYDVIYRRWSSGDGSSIGDHQQNDDYAFGYRVLQEGLVVGSGTAALSPDVEPTSVAGDLVYAAGPLPTHSTSTTDIAVYLRARDTGSEQLLEVVTFGSWDGTGYPQRTFNDRDDLVVDLPVLPGEYDLVYRRWSSGDGSSIGDHAQDDAYAFGRRHLRMCVALP